MTPAEVLAELSREHIAQPREALLSADGHRAQLVEPLLRALERGVANPEGLPEPEAQLFAYALYLVAKWREPRAYPLVCRFLSLPGDQAYGLGGDIATEDGARILAAVCDGNLDPIKSVILNREADEFCRATAIHALSLLAAWAEVPRESIEAWFLWLATEGLEREPSDAWDGLCSECVDIEALPVFPALRRAYDDGLASDMSMDPTEMDQVEREPRGLRLADTQDRYPPIDDVAEAISWWASFAAASAKIGRNEPCPCGSGKKYKKCHGA
jgi:hypothetical protein